MAGNEQKSWRMKRGRQAAVGAVITLAALATAGSALAAPRLAPASSRAGIGVARQSSGPRAGRPGHQVGWDAVPYRDAQLSVPGPWLVQTPGQVSCWFGPAHGMIFAGLKPRVPKGMGCHLAASLAWIVPAGHLPAGIRHRKPTAVIHGIPVYRVASAKGSVQYVAPELKVRVGARGPEARRVLATLTRSPLAVVLGAGRTSPVPVGWTWRRFGGIRFATPSSWSQARHDQWETCGTGLWPTTVLLIDATKPPLALPCPYQPSTAASDSAQPGLTVVTGKFAAGSVGLKYARCRARDGLRICLSTVTGQAGRTGGVLIFSVARPHHRAATFLLLGLPGSGRSARAVFESIS
jgi:hypothetical protein